MGRLLLTVAASLLALVLASQPAVAAEVRTGSGRDYERSEAVKEYLKRLDEEDARAEAANEAARLQDEALRREKAADIAAHNARINAWLKANPPPAGTTETLVADSFDDAFNPEYTRIIYLNRHNVPTHEVELDADAQTKGPVTQTQQGKAWETIGPQLTDGRRPQLVFGSSLDGQDVTIDEAIITEGGKPVARYEFNEDGIPWRGETFDPRTGRRTGGFQDDRLKPTQRTLGGPLDVPAQVRLITGPCETCRPPVERANDLAREINARVVEMQSLSEQHQKAYNPAQGPLRARHDVLRSQVEALMPQYEAAKAEALACERRCQAQRPDQPYEDILEEIADPPPAGPRESILDEIDDPADEPDSILDEIEEPTPPTPTAREPEIQPTSGAFPVSDEDLERVLKLANDYLAAANCDGMECPRIDCEEARRALQALVEAEAYLKRMVFYLEKANADHMAQLTALAESNILNGEQRDWLIRVIAIQEFYQNFGSMMLDIASVGSWAKGLTSNPGALDDMSPAEMLDKINDLYQASKDLESLVSTLPSRGNAPGVPNSTGIADAVDMAGGVDKDFVNNTTSTITDLKSIAVDARTIIEEARKNGTDWRSEFRKSGILSAVGQITGRYLKQWSQSNLAERQQRLNDLLRDAEAGDIVQARAYQDLQRVQRRRWAAVDALAAVQQAREAYQNCLARTCGLMSVIPPVIPDFDQQGPQGVTKFSWGAALPWLNGAILRTIPRLRPVAFIDDCPDDEDPRADPGEPRDQGVLGDPAALPPEAARPPLAPLLEPVVPASFCTQVEKVNFLTGLYNPAAATALSNSQLAQAHMARLNGLFTHYMRNEGGPIWAAIQREMAAYKLIAEDAYETSNRINALYDTIMAVPVVDCPHLADNTDVGTVPSAGDPVTPVNDPKPSPKPGDPDCPPEQRRKPIVVGPNGKVGSGARLKAKAASTALGIAGGLLGGAAGLPAGGGGRGGGGPQLVTCKIKDSEMTVFTDPVTGVSLRVGAKRAGGTVVVFADIARSPDNGTFQTAFLENPRGEAMAPADVGICDLWGEWKLTVSWTRSTYVDGQLVSRESGGWSEMGKFVIPGTLSSADKPDGLWKRLGFSNASHGARKIAMQYRLPAGGGPVDLVVHVTQPGGDPVTTVPFAIRMVEGPGGFTLTQAPAIDCPPGETPTLINISNTPQTTAAPTTAPPPAETSSAPRPPVPVNSFQSLQTALDNWKRSDDSYAESVADGPCPGGLDNLATIDWRMKLDRWIENLEDRHAAYNRLVPTGPDAARIGAAIDAERVRTQALLEEARALRDKGPSCPAPTPASTASSPPAPEPETPAEDILEEIDTPFVPS